MSRIGRMAIKIPENVGCFIKDHDLVIKGPKGHTEARVPKAFKIEMGDKHFHIFSTSSKRSVSKTESMLHGTICRLVANMIIGVSKGFEKNLQLIGVGYRAELQSERLLKLSLGYSHDVIYTVPEGISIDLEKQTFLKIKGIDKQKVGQVASEIIRFRPPEPYKGKGVRVVGQFLRMKEGKK